MGFNTLNLPREASLGICGIPKVTFKIIFPSRLPVCPKPALRVTLLLPNPKHIWIKRANRSIKKNAFSQNWCWCKITWEIWWSWQRVFIWYCLGQSVRCLRQKMLGLLPCFDCFLRTASLLSLSDAVMSFSQFHHNHFVILWHSCASASLEMLRYGTNGIIIGLGGKKHNTAGMTVQTAFLSLLLPSQMQWKGKMWAQTSMVIVYVNSFLSLSF